MKWLAPLYGVIGLLVSGAARADDIFHAHISCDGTVFSAVTKQVIFAPYFQMITARFAQRERAIDLREPRREYPWELGTRPGLGFSVGMWQCRKTPIGFVLVLHYECPQGTREGGSLPECDGLWAWHRFVAMDGTLLDAGYAIYDQRYAALRRKLGIPDETDDGPWHTLIK